MKALFSKKPKEMTPEKETQGNHKQKKGKEKTPYVKKSIAEIIPIIDLTEEGLLELKDSQGYFDILQLESKDIFSMNAEETSFNIYNLTYFFQAYQYPIKIVSLNFPVSTEKQQHFIQKKIESCTNPLYERFLNQKLEELQFLEWGRTNREYFLFVYAETELLVQERVDTVKRYLQRSIPAHSVSEEKKLEILYKLYNQNTKLGQRK